MGTLLFVPGAKVTFQKLHGHHISQPVIGALPRLLSFLLNYIDCDFLKPIRLKVKFEPGWRNLIAHFRLICGLGLSILP